MITLGVLISGGGRSLQNLIDVIGRGELPARIAVVVSSLSKVKGVERARAAGLPVEIARVQDHPSVEAFSERIVAALERHRVELACQAGFTAYWRIPERWIGRVMNIHPALLPNFGGKGFYGRRVHEAVLRSGARESGCTVHFADEQYDHGPIILQKTVPVLPGDTPETLAERVFGAECEAYPEAIRRVAARLGVAAAPGGGA